MSIRLRLALWYGALFALVLLVVTLLSYSFHVRGHYDDRDRALITSAGHLIGEVGAMNEAFHLIEGRGGLEVGFRLYDHDGALSETTGGIEELPPSDPRAILARPAGAPFDALAGLAPSMAEMDAPKGSAFGLLSSDEQRWRSYIVPLQQGNDITGYLETLTPLGHLDAAIRGYRNLMVGLGLSGLAIALVGGWAIAGGALAPVTRLTQTAHVIAHSRDLARRVEMPRHHDELGRLAATFNEMLTNLEVAYQAQRRFVADASHELRAPLTAMQGNLELLRRHPDLPPDARDEALAEAERETVRLSRLVSDLLALARADAGITLQRQPVDLDSVTLDAFRTARTLAHGQELVLNPFEPVQVAGDADRLKQLLLILLDNALKYTPPNGRVTLGLRCDATHAEILAQDTGVGIAPADLPHIFERFYRADPARRRDPGGTGLGLSIAQWITQQHDGTIAVNSAPGQGTTITVRLPLLAEHTADRAPDEIIITTS